jgi:hypothetical protein
MDFTDRQWASIGVQIPPAYQGRGRPTLDSRMGLSTFVPVRE